MSRLFIFIVLSMCSVQTWANTNVAEGQQGVVASRSIIASQVGVDIMQQGGNAVDAAVAVGFALSVTYPSAGNLGGGGFMLLHTQDGQTHALDFRETAPAKSTESMFLDSEGNVVKGLSVASHLSAGVPGSVAGLLVALKRYGVLSREQVMAPAIKLAEEGFSLPADLAAQFERHSEKFKQYPASRKKFTCNNTSCKPGELWRQPKLAHTLRLISMKGRDGFYKGETAQHIVTEMKRGNGVMSLADLQNYQAKWRKPVQGSYRGFDIWGMPPPSSGGVLISEMLNMLEPYNLADTNLSSSDRIHMMIEAERRAYADRAVHLGDADFYPVPLTQLLDKEYARDRFADFNPDRATDSDTVGAGQWPEESHQTTHYSIMDKRGNAVSVTTTLNLAYGNKIVVEGAGFLLNNEMDDFSSKPGTPNSYGLLGNKANSIEPDKRMLSSMSPTVVTLNGSPFLVTGSPGGSTIITTTFQVLLNVIDQHMSLASAVKKPRFHHQWKPNKVFYESNALSKKNITDLKAKHHINIVPSPWAIGDANSVIRRGKRLIGVSDPRNLGGVVAY